METARPRAVAIGRRGSIRVRGIWVTSALPNEQVELLAAGQIVVSCHVSEQLRPNNINR